MINVAIIGLGRSGWELHAQPLSQLDGYGLKAVCDTSPVRLKRAAQTFDAKPVEQAADVFSRTDIDLVIIAAPSNFHKELTISALKSGKHVVVEKPMAMALSDAEEMLETAKQEGLLLSVFHNRHWDKDYQILKGIVNQGFLGDLMTINSRVMTYGPEWANFGVPEFNSQWRTQATFGGGFLSDWGPHLVEQILDLLAEWPQRVFCQLRSQIWSEEVDDYFFVRLDFPSGKLVTLEASNNSRTPLPRWFVTGTEGTLIAKGEWGHWEDMRIRTTTGGIPINVSPQTDQTDHTVSNYDVGEELSFQFYVDLAKAIENGGQLTVSTEHARDVMAVLETTANPMPVISKSAFPTLWHTTSES